MTGQLADTQTVLHDIVDEGHLKVNRAYIYSGLAKSVDLVLVWLQGETNTYHMVVTLDSWVLTNCYKAKFIHIKHKDALEVLTARKNGGKRTWIEFGRNCISGKIALPEQDDR